MLTLVLVATLLTPLLDAPPAAVAERWRPVLDGILERGAPGVSVGLVLPDGRAWALAVGVASLDDETPLSPDDRLLSGSVGKTYVTAAAHRLVLAGALDLDRTAASFFADDEPAPEWLDRVPNARDVTVRQLLRHESGIPRYVFKEAFFPAVLSAPDRVWRPEELLGYVHDDEPLFAAGQGWAYADTNYILVGMVLERVAGEPFHDQVREHVLQPLALADTVPSDRRRVPGIVQGHVVASAGMGFPERTLEDGEFVFNPQFEWCGGGYANTPLDLARWARLLYGGDALEGEYLESLLDAVDAPGLGSGVRYGLGVMLRQTPLGELRSHDGFMPGYVTSMGYLPELGMAAAIQVNTDDSRVFGRPPTAVLVELVALTRDALRDGGDR